MTQTLKSRKRAALRCSRIQCDGQTLVVFSVPHGSPDSSDPLTESEEELVELLCLGLSNTEIAERRGTSQTILEDQLRALYQRLDMTQDDVLARYRDDPE